LTRSDDLTYIQLATIDAVCTKSYSYI